MFHKVCSVIPFGGMSLVVWFEGGEARLYDVGPLLSRWPAFEALRDEALFNSVKIVARGYGIAWNDDVDLSCDELFHNGRRIDFIEAGKDRIAAEVVMARSEAGLSQSGLESASGVSQPVIARLERGETAPQVDTLLKVLAPLGKTLAVVDMGLEHSRDLAG